jgi:hypothetical protein
MTIERDIQKLEDLVKHIEECIGREILNGNQQKVILSEIDEADTVFDRIITKYINVSENPSLEQASLVSDLQERLHHAKHNLPSPPISQEHRAIKIDKGVIIYTTPT